MRQDMPLGRVAGIRVLANWTAAVFVVIIAWLPGASYLPSATEHPRESKLG